MVWSVWNDFVLMFVEECLKSNGRWIFFIIVLLFISNFFIGDEVFLNFLDNIKVNRIFWLIVFERKFYLFWLVWRSWMMDLKSYFVLLMKVFIWF